MSCDRPWQQTDVSIEEDMIRLSAEELPAISRELRQQVLEAATKAYGNNRLLHRLQIATIAFMCISFTGLLGTYYLALFRVGFGGSHVTAQESESLFRNMMPAVQTESEQADQNALQTDHRPPVGDILYGPIVNAAASSDEWALVDAYGAQRNSKSDTIRKFLWH